APVAPPMPAVTWCRTPPRVASRGPAPFGSALGCATGAVLSLVPEQAVAGVAEAGYDVALFIEPLVDRRGVDRHVGVLGVKRREAFGAGQQAHELDLSRRCLLEAIDGGE